MSSTTFQPAITCRQVVADMATGTTPLLEKNVCDLSKIPPLLRNLTLKDDNLIVLN